MDILLHFGAFCSWFDCGVCCSAFLSFAFIFGFCSLVCDDLRSYTKKKKLKNCNLRTVFTSNFHFRVRSNPDSGYVHTKPDNFENATFAAKTDKMFSVHINRFQTVSLSTLKRCLSPRTLARQSLRQSHMVVVTSAFSKSSVFAVHTNTLSRRFQIYPLWRAFSKSSVFGHRKRRFSVDGRPIRIKKVAFSNLSGLVWTEHRTCSVTVLQ